MELPLHPSTISPTPRPCMDGARVEEPWMGYEANGEGETVAQSMHLPVSATRPSGHGTTVAEAEPTGPAGLSTWIPALHSLFSRQPSGSELDRALRGIEFDQALDVRIASVLWRSDSPLAAERDRQRGPSRSLHRVCSIGACCGAGYRPCFGIAVVRWLTGPAPSPPPLGRSPSPAAPPRCSPPPWLPALVARLASQPRADRLRLGRARQAGPPAGRAPLGGSPPPWPRAGAPPRVPAAPGCRRPRLPDPRRSPILRARVLAADAPVRHRLFCAPRPRGSCPHAPCRPRAQARAHAAPARGGV